jgi:hypothetical protein
MQSGGNMKITEQFIKHFESLTDKNAKEIIRLVDFAFEEKMAVLKMYSKKKGVKDE